MVTLVGPSPGLPGLSLRLKCADHRESRSRACWRLGPVGTARLDVMWDPSRRGGTQGKRAPGAECGS